MIIALLLILPLIASVVLFTGILGSYNKLFAFIVSMVVLATALFSAYAFMFASDKILSIDLDLKKMMDINIQMKLDAVSLLLVLLTCVLIPIIIASTRLFQRLTGTFYALVLLMEMALIGVFTSSDMILFYLFWELALIPIFFITAFWGRGDSKKISIKFLIYTIVGSFAMLIAILYMYTLTPDPHTFSIAAFSQIRLPYNAQLAVFAAFFLAFAIKIPLFPFHSWQAETYNASPVQGSMLLAGIMLKMGLYGIIRFLIPFCPDVLTATSGIYMPFILFGVIYGAFIAITEPMMKRLIAFASLSHVGLISLGLFAGNVWAFEGAVLQMFSHGVNVVGMFLCYQIIVKRTNTDRIAELGGIASVAPRFTIAFFIIVLANIGLPLTNSFVGEYLILLGLFQSHPIMAVVAGTSIIFGAVYMLKLFQKLMYGQKNSITSSFSDLTTIEILMLLPIILLIFVIGIYPTPVLQMLEEVYRSLK